ncbi:hypothetical protein DPMN_037365, partial [Dreissena polymorpha]
MPNNKVAMETVSENSTHQNTLRSKIRLYSALKTAPTPGGHVFPSIMTIFELVRDIYKIDAKHVTS